MKLARRVTFAFTVLCLSLATCVLGRPHPSSASSEHSAVEVLEQSSLVSSSPLLGFFHVPTVEVPFKQERRLLNGSAGRAAKAVGKEVGTTIVNEYLSTTTIIVLLVLVLAFLFWCGLKKKKNPNWRFADYFKREKPTAEKICTSVKSDVDPDAAAAEHKMTIDGPRLDHASKSRKQASLNHEFNNTSTFQ